MTFATAVRTCLARYVTFSGRASRSEYWYFVLFVVLAELIAGIVDWTLFGASATVVTETGTTTVATAPAPVQSVVSLALFLPHLAAAWRRMHDTGRSGWYVLLPTLLSLAALAILVIGIGTASLFDGGTLDRLLTGTTLLILIPTGLVLLVSPLLVLWWLTRPSQPGHNAYGPNPHEVTP